jgi:LacI family transcriptional regulator
VNIEEMKTITIKDISQITGFSPMTVSRVVNNEKHVRTETREKVTQAIQRYGYEPNYFARSLKTKQSKTVGLIIGDIENPYYSRLSKGVIDTAEKFDYNVMVCNSKYSPERGEKYLNMLIKRGVDGLIIATIDFSKDLIHNVKRKHIPLVLVTRRMDEPEDINYIVADDYYGGRLAAEYLVNLGHRRIYFLRTAEVLGAIERVRAFKDVLRSHKFFFDESYVSPIVTNADESYGVTTEFLEKRNGFTAIIAANDFIAIGAMEAILDANLSIPDDISLIGYDNLKITSILKVPLTTIDQPKLSFGKLAAERLIEMILDPEKAQVPLKTVMKPSLVQRASCRRV